MSEHRNIASEACALLVSIGYEWTFSDGWERPTIHPPAHYQIDTSTPGWNTRYVDAVAKEHGWTRAEAQGRIADGGAG